MAGSSTESLLISLSLSVFPFRGRSRSVSVSCKRIVKVVYSQTAPPSWPNLLCFFILSAQNSPTCISFFYFRLFSQLSLASALVCLLTYLLPERERAWGKQKRGKRRDAEREREKEMGLIRRHWVSCHKQQALGRVLLRSEGPDTKL